MTRKKWIIVAFDHPGGVKSIIYRQGIDPDALLKAVRDAMAAGANLMSIRGFDE